MSISDILMYLAIGGALGCIALLFFLMLVFLWRLRQPEDDPK